jgi:hypothetical protein
MTHELKTWQPYFQSILDGWKNFELRKDDRGYTVGDTLLLKEFDSERWKYTGRETSREISYILPGGDFGLECGYSILGLTPESAPTEAGRGEAFKPGDKIKTIPHGHYYTVRLYHEDSDMIWVTEDINLWFRSRHVELVTPTQTEQDSEMCEALDKLSKMVLDHLVSRLHEDCIPNPSFNAVAVCAADARDLLTAFRAQKTTL